MYIKSTIHGIYGKWDWQNCNVKYYCWVIKTIKWKVLVDGIKIKNNLKAWQSMIGYLPQDTFLLNESKEQYSPWY